MSLSTPVYTMHVEKPAGVVKQHGFHLGTDRAVAESFVMERLRNDDAIISICLRLNGKFDMIYDFRDLTD